MRSTRRVSAAFMFLLMLHVVGLGSGVLRAHSGSADCAAAMAHTGDDMPDTGDMGGMPMPDAPPASGDHGSDAPCGLPWAFGCTSAAACVPLVVPVAAASATNGALAQVRIIDAYTSLPESFARAPELQPPRS